MKLSEVCLGWDESQKHHLALSEIEDKNSLEHYRGKISNGLQKKTDAKIHNEKNEYLRKHELIQRCGLFYKTVISSDD